jgi:hypothetical protein
MPISFRTATQNSSTTGTAISVSAPIGTTAGDLVKIVVHANGQTTIVDNNGATPFTEQINDYQPNTTNGQTMSVFSRVIQSGDPTTYNFTSGASGRWAIIAISITDSLTPVDDDPPSIVDATNRDSSVDGTAVTASINTISNNAFHIVVAGWDTASIGTITTPAGYTLLANANGGGNPIHASYKSFPTPSSTGTKNIVNTEFGAYITFSFSVRPADDFRSAWLTA